MIVFSMWLASFGYWSDFGVPVLGIALDRLFEFVHLKWNETRGHELGHGGASP